MDANQLRSTPLALEPIDEPTPSGDAAPAMGVVPLMATLAQPAGNEPSTTTTVQPASDVPSMATSGPRELPAASADDFLAQATKEYEQGHIDPDLWAWASMQAGKDESLVLATYLRVRSTALHRQKRTERLERRERRERRARGERRAQSASDSKAAPERPKQVVAANAAVIGGGGAKLNLRQLGAAAAALVGVAAVVWVIASPGASDPAQQPTASAATSSPARTAPPTPSGKLQAVVASAGAKADPGDAVPSPESMVEQLKQAGNWNVLVLHASKWTRQQPDNATAWNELSIGYAKLRQFDEAIDAATKAVRLAPDDPLLWRNLGHVNLAVDLLNEAGIAFDRALTLRSDDADALCGAAMVAQRQGRAKEAEAIARRIKPYDGKCLDASAGETVSVVVGSSAARRRDVSAGR